MTASATWRSENVPLFCVCSFAPGYSSPQVRCLGLQGVPTAVQVQVHTPAEQAACDNFMPFTLCSGLCPLLFPRSGKEGGCSSGEYWYEQVWTGDRKAEREPASQTCWSDAMGSGRQNRSVTRAQSGGTAMCTRVHLNGLDLGVSLHHLKNINCFKNLLSALLRGKQIFSDRKAAILDQVWFLGTLRSPDPLNPQPTHPHTIHEN